MDENQAIPAADEVKTQLFSPGNDIAPFELAVRQRAGVSPGFFWLGGWRSDMAGTKAQALDRWCADHGFACCRFDYSGHGESAGDWRDGTISRWLAESLAVFDAHTRGPQILVGSSMGGWIALRMAQELAKRSDPPRLAGMLLIAPAPDFTHELMLPKLTARQHRDLDDKGYFTEDSGYSDEPNIWTRAFIEDGANNRVMGGLIATGCPVHILQGVLDPDVPADHARKLAQLLAGENVTMTLVRDGDHRLSRDQDIATMLRICGNLAARRETLAE